MAESASTLELQNRRALDAGRFAERQVRQTEPADYIRRQTAGVGLVDGAQLSSAEATSARQANTAPMGATYESDTSQRLLERLKILRRNARTYNEAGNMLVDATNKKYKFLLNSFQTQLITQTMALEVVVSPWVFISMYFLRVVRGAFRTNPNRLNLIPSYGFRTQADIGIFIWHTTAFCGIIAFLFFIFIIVALVVWYVTNDPITQSKFFLDILSSSFGAFLKAFGAGSPDSTGAAGGL
ncbi:MAG: hypothetical protein AAB515_01265 [Patescibacteria group bacterium]